MSIHPDNTAQERDDRITVKVQGLGQSGPVDFDNLIAFLDDLRACFRKVANQVIGGDEDLHLLVDDMAYGSAKFGIVARARSYAIAVALMQQYAHAVREIEASRKPEGLDIATLEAFAEMGKHYNKIGPVEFNYRGMVDVMDSAMEPNARKLMGPVTKTTGSVRGYLEAVNLHKQHKCYIFPVGDWPKVICTFREAHTPVVLRNLQKFVTVNGIAHYRPGEVTPHEMNIREIVAHEPLDDVPGMDDLHGIAPEITGDLDTLAFLERLRG